MLLYSKSLFGEKMRRNCPRALFENEVSCLTKSEYSCIKSRSSIEDEVNRDKSDHSQDKKQKSRERKERMIAIDQERLKKSKTLENKSSQKGQVNKENLLKNEKSEDIVKQLNTIKQRAASFSVRDKQLQDKKLKVNEEKEYERLMELSMEVKRLSDIAASEKEEESMIKKRIADRKVIEQQIQERQHQKLLQEEARDQENRKMLERIKKYQEEDMVKERKRKEDAQKAQEEIIRRNKEILAEHEGKKAFEKHQDEMIIAYQARRDEELKQREEEERELQRKKIELQRKMLESHTKSIDRKSAIDELRARRAAEEKERKNRQRELNEARKRKKNMELLHESRKMQEEERRISKEKEFQEKQEEYFNVIAHAAEMAKRERDEAECLEKKNTELRTMLKHQIMENESKKSAEEQEKFKEGREMKMKMDAEHVKLESIREKMVEEMRTKGVDEKYFGEMLTFDIDKLLKK
mmetsp:Transcript_9391/g.10930  ORF Transcript_9391/g.10930 Transcript_9391/m.10930 type:complete len:467 (+) Transcript_9391:99-1499(+)